MYIKNAILLKKSSFFVRFGLWNLFSYKMKNTCGIIFFGQFQQMYAGFIPRIKWYMPFLSMQLNIWKHYLIHPALIVLYPTFSLLYIVVSFVRIFQEIPTSIIQGYCYDFFNDLSILGRAVGTRGAGCRVRFETFFF